MRWGGQARRCTSPAGSVELREARHGAEDGLTYVACERMSSGEQAVSAAYGAAVGGLMMPG